MPNQRIYDLNRYRIGVAPRGWEEFVTMDDLIIPDEQQSSSNSIMPGSSGNYSQAQGHGSEEGPEPEDEEEWDEDERPEPRPPNELNMSVMLRREFHRQRAQTEVQGQASSAEGAQANSAPPAESNRSMVSRILTDWRQRTTLNGTDSALHELRTVPEHLQSPNLYQALWLDWMIHVLDPVPTTTPTITGTVYDFVIPQQLVGRLIGSRGRFVKLIRRETGATVIVKRHPSSEHLKIATVKGTRYKVETALSMIRKRFPGPRYDFLTLEKINCQNSPSIGAAPTLYQYHGTTSKLNFVLGIITEVIVCDYSNMNNLFVHQPTNPTYQLYGEFLNSLSGQYSQNDTPQLEPPVNVGVYCVARINVGYEDMWYRAEVVHVVEERQVATVRLLDCGGYKEVSIQNLRQIGKQFLNLPFQAIECQLADLIPRSFSTNNHSDQWHPSALDHFRQLCNENFLQAQVVSIDETTGISQVYLYKLIKHEAAQRFIPVLINQELVDHGFAFWKPGRELHEVLGSGYLETTTDETVPVPTPPVEGSFSDTFVSSGEQIIY